jgi:hypothetical protein
VFRAARRGEHGYYGDQAPRGTIGFSIGAVGIQA